MSESQNKAPLQPKGPMGGGPPQMAFGRPKEFGKSLGKLAKYCKKHLLAIIIAIVLAVVGTVFSIIGPDLLGNMTDHITKGILGKINMEAVTQIGVALLVMYSIAMFFIYIQGYIMATLTQRVSKNLRCDISKKLNVLPLRYFDKTSYGDVLSRVTNDVDMIGQSLNQSIVSMVTSVVMLVGVSIMMFSINYIMAFTAIGASLIGFLLMAIVMAKSQKHFFAQQKSLGELNGQIEEVYSGHNVVKAFNAGDQVKGQFSAINTKLFGSAWKSQFMSGVMMPIMHFIGNFGFVAVCVVGGALAMKEKISFGVIVSFMLYVRLFTQPLSQIAQVATSLQSTAAASERVFEFLEEEQLENESHKTKKLDKVIGEIEFENVSFGYNEDKIIIKDFSAKVGAGQKVAIVGPTGAGKTTMVNLLMRFYEINSGKIKIDGVPISELTRENIHDIFGMVLQDTWIFDGTIRENIVYSKEGVTDDDLARAAKASGIDHFIKTLPHGYDTVLNDSANLSAGQKQLITIARAMIEDAPMLILDEATSSVDTRTEVLIQKAMDNLAKGRTSFVIAHRLSTIKNADLILVMKDGDILESGSHDMLMSQKGFYSGLYNSQFS